MAELSRSFVIEWVRPSVLKANPENLRIYGQEAADPTLVDSIRELGILEAAYVKADNTLVSGHRRWVAAQAITNREILMPVIRVTYASADEEVESIIEHNRQREKTLGQIYEEGVRLEAIYAKRAKERQASSGPGIYGGKPVKENLPEPVGQTRDQVAAATGLGSGKQWDKLKTVHKAAQAGDESAKKKLTQSARRPSLNAVTKQVQDKERQKQQHEQIIAMKPPQGQYQVLVMDPPWAYSSRQHDSTHRARNPYESMTVEELADFKIPAADNCILWLWTTNAFMHEAFHLLDQWGFEYKSCLTWAKEHMGLGDWLRGKTEHCLLAVKGTYRISPGNATTLLQAPNSAHSAKPAEFYDLVERLCPGEKIDIFARHKREGWAVWGAEVEK